MILNVLHVDDEADVLQRTADVMNGTVIGDYEIQIRDSCGFDEGMQKLSENSYDLVILDLCAGKASPASEKLGEEVFNLIKEKTFVPIVFFTGLPGYVESSISDIVKVAGKADGYDNLINQIKQIIDSGVIEIKYKIDAIVKEGMRSYFWNFIHQNAQMVEELRRDDVSLNYILLRRLGKLFSKELTREATNDPDFRGVYSHPMEFYIYPYMRGEYENGDLIKFKNADEYYVIMTPSCDLVKRNNGVRSAETILIIAAKHFTSIPDYKNYEQINKQITELENAKTTVSQELKSKLKNSQAALRDWIKPGKKERYFFLPKTPFVPALLVDFQSKKSILYEDLEANYTPIASLDNPISQAVQASYTRYYSRVGYQDLDVDYALKQITSNL